MTTVGRIYRFRGVHSLQGYPEPWCFPHQHDYTVEVEVAGGIDTLLLDGVWQQMGFINVVDMDSRFNPSTVERISEQLLEQFRTVEERVLSVTVWEDRQRWGRSD